jgi:GNAT superfamily N-acetyltransferase
MSKKKEKKTSPAQTTQFEIFEAQSFDLKALVQLFDRYRQFYKQKSDIQAAKTFLAERIKLKDSVIYLAFDEDSNAIGFTQLYPLFSSVSMKKTWLLNDLFVEKSCRAKGVSKLLIESAKQLARDSKSKGLMLETEKTNSIGLKLYPSAGFELTEGSNFYFWKCD